MAFWVDVQEGVDARDREISEGVRCAGETIMWSEVSDTPLGRL